MKTLLFLAVMAFGDLQEAIIVEAKAEHALTEAQQTLAELKAAVEAQTAEVAIRGNLLAEARAQREVLMEEYLVSLDPAVVEPPIIVEPPVVIEPPIVDPLDEYLAALPFEVPPLPQYEIPTIDDCEWIIENGVATSTRGLPPITGDYLIGPAYRASVAAGHELPIDFGVWDDAGMAVFGGGWSAPTPYNHRSVFVKNEDGTFEDLRARIVGLDDECEVGISWDNRWGYVEELGLYNIGIRGQNDSFIVRTDGELGDITIDGCWWLAHENFVEGQRHTSGFHTTGWERLIWRRHQWRGEAPGTPGVDLREHSGYLEASRGETWILENDLRGGNRTGFQIRPGKDKLHLSVPVGHVVIAGNYAHGYGWNNGDTPETFDGGSCLSIWSNPNYSTFIVGNTITDAKYGCLMVGAQQPSRNWLNEEGFAIGPVYVWDNTFENAQVGREPTLPKREAVSITGVQELHWGPNEMLNDARLTLDNEWGIQVHGIYNGDVFLYDDAILEMNVWTWDGKNIPLTTEQIEAMAAWQ